MSTTFFVFTGRTAMPTLAAWQRAITEAGFDLQLDESFDPIADSGFVPASFEGLDAGFEYGVGPADAAAVPAVLSEAAVDMDLEIAFTVRSESEVASACVASGALAALTGGRLYDETSSTVIGATDALSWARAAVRGLREDAEPAKSPQQWAEHSLRFLRGIHPGYQRNTQIRGACIEFARRHESGLWVSQNFVRTHGEYYLSFGLLFSVAPTAYGPLLAGGRFDHNRAIWRLVDEMHAWLGDCGRRRPPGTWSSSPWRSNTLPLLERGLRVPEEHLLPFYLARLQSGSANLESLFACAARVIPPLRAAHAAVLKHGQVSQAMLEVVRAFCPGFREEDRVERARLLEAAHTLHLDVRVIEERRLDCCALDALSIAAGGHCYRGYGPADNCFDVDQLPAEAIVVNHFELFATEANRLDELVETAHRLGR